VLTKPCLVMRYISVHSVSDCGQKFQDLAPAGARARRPLAHLESTSKDMGGAATRLYAAACLARYR
jgi:hypothetical protein